MNEPQIPGIEGLRHSRGSVSPSVTVNCSPSTVSISTFAPGQFFGLLGPNRVGKTTTIHMLSTLIRPTAGAVQVAGFRRCAAPPFEVREAIGIVFQESALDR